MISDGLYVSLVGLAIVFLVLIILLIAITLLNLIESKKSFNNTSNELTKISTNENFSKLELTAALVGVSLALEDNKDENISLKEPEVKFGNSNWKALGQQRLFKGRGS